MEIWKDVVGFEGLYQVSNLGNVKGLDRVVSRKDGTEQRIKGVMLNQFKKKNGRVHVNLSKDGKRYSKTVHRLVLTAFVENVNNYPHINHKDEDPTNNKLENLEWCTEEYNHNYGTRNARQAKALHKKVNVFDRNGNFIRQYESIKSAAQDLRCDESSITKVCKKKYKYHKDYTFKYAA